MNELFERLQQLRTGLPGLLGQRAAAYLHHFHGEPFELRQAAHAFPSVYHPDAGKVVEDALERFGPDAGLDALKAALALERIRWVALAEEEDEKHEDRILLQREAISSLGGSEPWSFLAGLRGFEGVALEEEADAALEATEDAFRELTDWSLARHVNEKLSLGSASEDDLETLEGLAWLTGIFPAGGLRLTALGTFDEMGFDVRRRGVRLDLEKRSHQPKGARVFALAIPSRIWVALSPTGTPADWPELFSALGRGFALSSVSPAAPVEEVWTGDAILGKAFAALLGDLVGSRLFLQRKVKATSSEVAQARRGLSLASLLRLRRLCGEVLVEREVWRSGVSQAALRAVGELRERALGVASGTGLEGIDPDLPASTALRALSLAPILEDALFERFDEDWWRNPRTGPWLHGLFAAGTRGSPEALAALLEGGAPSLAAWTSRAIASL